MTDYTTMTNDELSAEVARRLFGWVFTANSTAPIPYASDHNAAMGLVVPEMRKGWLFCIDDFCGDGDHSAVTFFAKESAARGEADCKYGEEPRAICLAALAALDAEEGRE